VVSERALGTGAGLKARSPITYIQNVHTPLMLIEGESDLRIEQASALHRDAYDTK